MKDDPRVKQAKALLLEVVAEASAKVEGPKGADPARVASYEKLVDGVKGWRGSGLLWPYVTSGVGRGALVELLDGSVKLDFVNGIGVHPGHSLPEMIEAGIDGALDDTLMQGNLQQNERSFALMERLTALSGLDHCFLTTSGVMACENALKICFQKNFPRQRVLAFKRNFIGRTLAACQITDKAAYREEMPPTLEVDYLPFNSEETFVVLDELLARYPSQHAAMVMELVQGEGGFYPGTAPFFQKLADKLHEHGILVIADEVQTFGRTPELFAFQYFGLQDRVDLVTAGKLLQTCVTLFRDELTPRPGLVTQTFTSSSTAIYGAHAILDLLEKGERYGPQGRHAVLGGYFAKKLEGLPMVSAITTCGLMVAFTPYDGESKRTWKLARTLFDKGLMVFPCGVSPVRIRFLLPVCAVDEQTIDLAIPILEEALVECAP